MTKILWQPLLVPILVGISLFSLSAMGMYLAFRNGTSIRLRG
ncbi:hypothetical protein [Polaromonas sp. CG_9.11]|nr:hypothetical protein [Polaromonas sp. CG_9.11]MBG6074216.1 hypothetical protein [Polaromonas sp. CG_9.11]